ncbi:MAG: flagellar hook assembly protein FlgD [Planctomycetota bacterium]|jgi:hypothetical protein
MKLSKLAFLSSAILAICTSALAGEVAFSTAPAARRAGKGITIGFALSAAGDVEVAVLDAKGKVVRHLAAGQLGGKTPPPAPLKAGLAQSLAWDGKDDHGKPAKGAPFRVRVRAGMDVKYGRMIGGSPYTGTGESIAIDEKGNIYVLVLYYNGHCDPGLRTRQVRMYDREGKYVKTLLPYPASTPPGKATGMTLLDSGDPGLTPANMGSMYPCFFAFGESLHHRVMDGSLLFLHGKNRAHRIDGAFTFKLDGSNRVEKKRLMWSKTVPLAKYLKPQLAFTADGRYAYISSVDATGYNDKTTEAAAKKGFPVGRIYRQDLKTGKDPEPFFDLKMPSPGDKKFWVPKRSARRARSSGRSTCPGRSACT